MELRFLEGNFEHGKFKLQYREFDMHNQITEWKDVPCVKDKLEWCPHWVDDKNSYGQQVWRFRGAEGLKTWDDYTPNFCPACGVRRP